MQKGFFQSVSIMFSFKKYNFLGLYAAYVYATLICTDFFIGLFLGDVELPAREFVYSISGSILVLILSTVIFQEKLNHPESLAHKKKYLLLLLAIVSVVILERLYTHLVYLR